MPRRPHDTVLHRLVRAHYASFVAHAEATYAAPLPRYVKGRGPIDGCAAGAEWFARVDRSSALERAEPPRSRDDHHGQALAAHP